MPIKYSILCVLAFIMVKGNSQITEAINLVESRIELQLLKSINATEVTMATEKTVANTEELTRLEIVLDYGEKQLDLTKEIYKHYLNVVDAVETVSTTISTYKRLEDFYTYISGILQLYSDYGISLTFSSLYDLDKYLNPESQSNYLEAMHDIFLQAERLSSQMSTVVFKGREGVEASDYERLKAIRKLNNEARLLLFDCQGLVSYMLYLVPYKTNATNNNIELRESFFNYETYAK